MSNDPLELLVDAAAAARITRWIVSDFGPPPWDQLRGRFRQRLQERGGHAAIWADGTECGWCVGIYAAAGVMLARRVAPRLWPVAARWLACAEVAGLLLAEE